MSSPKKKPAVEPDPQSQSEPHKTPAAEGRAEVKRAAPLFPKVKPIPDDGDFVVGSKWTPVRQTKAYDSSCWLYSPARIEFLAEASDALVTVAELMGLTDQKIEKVEVVLQRSTKRLFFRPATEQSAEYYDVALTSNDYLSINIRSLLQQHGLEVKTGYQERHPVTLDVDSPIGPALVVDLTKVEERRQTAKHKAEKAVKAAKARGEEVAKPKRAKEKAKGTQAKATESTEGAAPPSVAAAKPKAKGKAKAAKANPEPDLESDDLAGEEAELEVLRKEEE